MNSQRARSSSGPLIVCVTFGLLLCTIRVRTDDPVSSNVRYTGEIVRILDRRCAACHGTNGLAMPLSNYREVRDWSRAIREEIVEQRMPPWSVARGHARFQNELALTSRESATILSWLDGGMPRGDDRDLPRPPAAGDEAPADLRLPLPLQHVPARDEHVIRRVTVDTNLTAPRRVVRVAVTPGHRRVLRGAFVFAEGGQWIGAWLPWQPRLAPPAPHAFHLPSGARLTVELHYRGGRDDVDDAPSLDLYFARDEVRQTPPAAAVSESIVTISSPLRLTTPTTAWAIVPSAAGALGSLELTVRRPDGAVDVLLWIPEYRPDWPQALALQDAVTLPAGAIVTLATEPRNSDAVVRLSLLPAAAAARATRSPIRTRVLQRRSSPRRTALPRSEGRAEDLPVTSRSPSAARAPGSRMR